MHNNSTKESLQTRINDFIQKNRKVIFIIVGVIVFASAGIIVALTLSEASNKKSIMEVEEFSRRYDELRYVMSDEESSSDVEKLLGDLEAFAKGKSGFAGGKAWSIVAQIHKEKNDWAQIENAWLNAAKASEKTYLGPVSYFNAAIAAEEQGKYTQAIELFEKCISLPVEFPQGPRAQFSIGRLHEKVENYPAAIEAYRQVFIKWPNIAAWVDLAHSRIIAIESL